MGILEGLTIIFVVSKILGLIAWSWWLVFSPLIVAMTIYLIMFLLFILGAFISLK